MRRETRSKTVYYEVYIAKDGEEFSTEERCIDHEKYLDGTKKICPSCGGRGYHEGKWVEPYDNYDIGHVEGHYVHNTCETCKGKGYLEKKVTWE